MSSALSRRQTYPDWNVAPPYVPVIIFTGLRVVESGKTFSLDDFVWHSIERYRFCAVKSYGAFL